MKKKTPKKLVLAKETVLRFVEGRGADGPSPAETGVLCPGDPFTNGSLND